jgi:pimeloyl-ACP methyl ester carboxylesterase
MAPFNIGAGLYAGQFAGLTDLYRLICVHHPGVGATTGITDLSLSSLAATARTALELLGEDGPVHVAGASFGGLCALTYALDHPDRCASLTLIGSSYRIGNRAGGLDRLDIVGRHDFDAVVQGPDGSRLAAQRTNLEQTLLRCESMDPRTGLQYLEVFGGRPDLLGRLGDVAVPTLIVQGALDTVIPLKTAHLLHGAIPDARYTELPGAGHFPSLTHATELNDLLAGFLTRTGQEEA